MNTAIPRVVIAGTTSGVGKTVITCSIIHALQKRGLTVQPFKVGPDYIDPSYLSSISNQNTYNLDVWLMRDRHVLDTLITHSKSDVSIIEGVMGYYDGYSGSSNHSSTYHVATITKSPVILVADASKSARSVAAIILGFLKFTRNSRICGIILNNIAGPKHDRLCRDALQKFNIPVVASIPRNPTLHIPSRHLGLITTQEKNAQRKQLTKITNVLSKSIDIDMILSILKNSKPVITAVKPIPKKPLVTTIAVAQDTSFNFYYPANLESLRNHGADLKFFSPVKDKTIPTCDGMYIGGGFPEVLADSLAKNQPMKKSIKRLAQQDMPIYAECGGLMYLTRSISSGNKRHKMVGLFDADTVMTDKMTLNYTSGTLSAKTVISGAARNIHGHEFHYSQLENVPSDSKFAYDLEIGQGITRHMDGLIQNNTLASYGHVYFASDSSFASSFVNNCRRYSKK